MEAPATSTIAPESELIARRVAIGSDSNPCTSCGACCAKFRVSFYWAESDAYPGGHVPVALTVLVTPHRLAMRGTDSGSPRCVALEGEVGRQVGCAIYGQRPTPCREFTAGDERCNAARRVYGLTPLG